MAVCVRLAARDMSAAQVACVRFAGAFAVLVLATRGRALRPRVASVSHLVLRGVLGASAICCYFVGIRLAGAGLATLLHSTYPVFTALFAVPLLGERFTARLGAALGLNLLGAAIVLGSPSVLEQRLLPGAIVALLGGVIAGSAVATASQLRRSESASVVTIWFMGVGAVLTAPAFLGGGPAWSASLAWALVGVVLTSTAGQWLLHHGLGHVSATAGSLAAATSVVTAAVLEALLLGGRPGGTVVLGGLVMLAAVWMATDRRPSVATDDLSDLPE
jgi:drug/metabolite transporter (DMT)-like permease